ncbi:DUF433 domain-containing protein [Halorubrum distributum]
MYPDLTLGGVHQALAYY